ncbi:Glycosyltransferase involved in cell wall bisynthesis [Roseomonas rosea]|uniref:Glycosyltransferase involved in cell wall bisynthesis n=1 Tax=Muricoccus roseus TaxID=198092 RepID=A0A1M6NAX0_9PROT|nr:glycosyltransferase [Roseomonas rosea]SHJ92822.1 Glycosyltransferase involved in cell wall bisynthesis [Roseomonas rosea]
MTESSSAHPAHDVQAHDVPWRDGSRPLRVLHLYRRFHPDYTGDGIYYTRLIPEMARLAVAGEILVYETKPDHDAATVEHEGVPVHYLANAMGRASIPALLGWLARHLHRYDVIHLHSHVDRLFLSTLFARLLGRRVLFSCTLNDSPTELLSDYRPSYRRLAALLMRSIGTFVVISPQLMRLARQSTAARRLRFIPQGVRLDRPPVSAAERLAARRLLGLEPDDFIVLNVGSVSRRKNVAFLVEVMAQMDDPRARLIVLGPVLEEDYAEEIRAAASRLGSRVTLAGFRDDPTEYYRAADAFAFASTAEGFPNVFLEAMACNLPIVTRFLPGLSDYIVDHGRSGFLAQSARDFAAALKALQQDPAMAAGFGLAGRRFAERNLELQKVAAAYSQLYREEKSRLPEPSSAFPEFSLRSAGDVRGAPASIGLREFRLPTSQRPLLQVVIDTEADFDWDKGTATDTGRVSSITGLLSGFDLFRSHGVRPALVLDYPVATQEPSVAIIRSLAAEGCELGVHLHGWSTPPEVELRDDWHSFSGNLGPALERRKLEALTDRVEALLGHRPRLFKSGRYGLGPSTIAALQEMRFEIDLSICPAYDFSGMGGPDFSAFSAHPGWFGREGGLLSLPTTAGWLGGLRQEAARLRPLVASPVGRALQLDRLSARANLLYPIRLSPEGNDLAAMKALTRQLHADGVRVFTLSLHSPTFQPGNTAYTRSAEDVRALLSRIDGYLAFFRSEMGGAFSTPAGIRAAILGSTAAMPAAMERVPA